jgi:hypothetical protein
LNRLPKVKRFINEFLPKYPDVELNYVGGADPEMIFLDASDKEVERVAVAEMSEEEICNLLEEKGLKSSKSEDNETDAGMNEEL